MRAIGLVGIAALAVVSAFPQLSAQAVSFRQARCARISDSTIMLLPPTRSMVGVEDGAFCPRLVNFTARVHLHFYTPYPQTMADARTPGEVLMQFVFDETGSVDTTHIVELR